jgi:uncharacterized protein (TIGR03067 family)
MRHAIGLTFLAVLVLDAWADDKPQEDEKLFGTWVLLSKAVPGEKPVPPEGDPIVARFSPGGTITWKKGKDEVGLEGSYKVVATKNPREIDLVYSKVVIGIQKGPTSASKTGPPGVKCILREASPLATAAQLCSCSSILLLLRSGRRVKRKQALRGRNLPGIARSMVRQGCICWASGPLR